MIRIIRTCTTPSHPLKTASYNSANRQTGFGSQTFTYDDNGQLTGDGTNIYTWNARGQLVAMSGPGVTASFSYDAVGRRSSKTINSATTIYLYDGANIVQQQVGGAASANALTGGADQVFGRTDASGTVTPVADALGSTIGLVNASGAIETSYSYEPFGKTTTDGAASSNTQKYTGREDDATGLYYYRARYYSPVLQRFISEDPIGLAGGINLYAYVGNNPINFRDPMGLDKTPGCFWDPFDLFAGPTACRWLGRAGTAAAGYGDAFTGGEGGLTDSARSWTGANDAVDKDSGYYTGGRYGAYATAAGIGGAIAWEMLAPGIVATEVSTATGSALTGTGLQFSGHALERMAERGITQAMIQAALRNGQRYWDPKSGAISYVLKNGFASGKDLLVGQNPISGVITTVIRGTNLVRSRMVPLP